MNPATPSPVIDLAPRPVDASPVSESRLIGKLLIRIKPGSKARDAYRQPEIAEAFHCNYELNPEYRPQLEKAGLVFTGETIEGSARIAELPAHSFFLGTGFVPQYASQPGRPHPLVLAYLKAARDS
jgi:CTP synthase